VVGAAAGRAPRRRPRSARRPHHPPRAGKDSTDHDRMHPGIWLGFGDVSGVDFWRNRGRMEHVRFAEPPGR